MQKYLNAPQRNGENNVKKKILERKHAHPQDVVIQKGRNHFEKKKKKKSRTDGLRTKVIFLTTKEWITR